MAAHPGISYHNHTLWSDGTGSVEAMTKAADRAGLREFGISDHFAICPYPDTNLEWALPTDQVERYIDEIHAAAEHVNLTVRLGIEVEFFPETVGESIERLKQYPFDYLIGGVHFANDFPIDAHIRYWEPLEQIEVNDIYRTYWQRVAELARTGLFDILAHLDLPKKFGFLPSIDLTAEIEAALDAISESGIVAELNTAGWDKPCAAPYPERSLLEALYARGVPTLISADGHAPEEVARHFGRAAELLRNVGFAQVVRFEARSRHVAPL